MYAITDPSPAQQPVEPLAGNVVDCSFRQVDPIQWIGTTKCKHGQTTSTTFHTGPVVSLNPTQMVVTAFRQHELVIGGDCPTADPVLNATVTYGPQTGVQPGERRIMLEQSASIQPPAKNFVYYGRIVCQRAGSYYMDVTLKLSRSVSAGARGQGQVFVAGAPAMLSAQMVDVAGVATAVVTGMLNLSANQPLAVAYVNTGTTAETVQTTTLKISEIWTP